MSIFGKQKAQASLSTDGPHYELGGFVDALEASQLIVELKPDGTVIRANKNFCAALKYSPDEIANQHHRLFLADSGKNTPEYSRMWDTLRAGKTVDKLSAHMAKDRSEVWLQASFCPVVDRKGNVVKIIKLASDATERCKREADMEGRLSAISRTQAVIEFDMSGTILDANENFLKTVGYTLPEIIGKHHRVIAPAELANSLEYKQFWETLNRGEYLTQRCKRVGKNGKVIWLQATYNPLMGPSGKLTKVVKYATDITEDKKDEEDLQALIAEAINVMGTLSEGDLTRHMQGTYKPELMELVNSINSTISQLDDALSNVNAHSRSLRDSSSDLNNLSSSTQAAAHQTADQTQDVVSATNQISQKIGDAVDALTQLVSSVEQVSTNSFEAASVAEKAVVLADSAKLNVNQLAQSSSDIGAVIKVINSIADQTNLLALNATIEAARAGDAGKGFAVVANEVKELAKETARATEEVSVKISAIQNDSQVAVTAINDIGSTIESISATQSTIANTVREQSDVSETISRSVNEVADGSRRIEATISKAAELAGQNQIRADDSRSTTANIGQLAESLGALVGEFKLKDR